MNPPLSGVRVLDLSQMLAGPFGSMILADLGAEVIKIEHPKIGDESRAWGPPWVGKTVSAYFTAINRNKKSLTLNFKRPEGIGIFKKLVAKADVVLENFRPLGWSARDTAAPGTHRAPRPGVSTFAGQWLEAR